MTANSATRAMLARRPPKAGMQAFGHVDVSSDGRDQLHEVVESLVALAAAKTEVEYHPDDLGQDDEVLVAPLEGFDAYFQPQAAWSLERAVAAIRATGSPETVKASEIAEGGWTFYTVRSKVGKTDAVVVRAKSPSYGLDRSSKIFARFVAGELKLLEEPLVAFDRFADLLVVDAKVYVLEPANAERLLIDADAVKKRAPESVATFRKRIKAALTPETALAVERVCSSNANAARRVERLIRDGSLPEVTAVKVREALPDAGLAPGAFGTSGALSATSDANAKILIDIAADLYYQPRFAAASRRVAVYRQVRRRK